MTAFLLPLKQNSSNTPKNCMHTILKNIAAKATESGEILTQLKEQGLNSVNELIGKTRLFGSLTADTEETQYDETHYFFVPIVGDEVTNAVYSKRVLPPDVGAENSLPKLRVFHLPDETATSRLEDAIVNSIVTKRTEADGSSDIADTLENIALSIDKETQKVSGGLLIIGGVVAVINPIAGIGIAAKALLPSVGSHLSKSGAKFIGNKLRKRNQSAAEKSAHKKASKEVKNLKPQIYVNSLLRSLDVIATNPTDSFDPSMIKENWADHFSPAYYYSITQEAIREVYKGVELATVAPQHQSWIRSLIDS